MKYIPDIIPADRRVLPKYFLAQANKQSPGHHSAAGNIRFASCAVLLFLTIISIRHWPVAILLLLAIAIILPFGRAWLENKLVFKMTFRITAVMVSIILVSAAGIDKIYRDQDAVQSHTEKQIAAAQARQQLALEQSRKHRADSIDKFITANSALAESGKYDEALRLLDTALTKTRTTDELVALTKAKEQLDRRSGLYYASRRQYRKAIPALSNAIRFQADPLLLYTRGICYSKLGMVQDAVYDLKRSMDAGNTDAAALYEKLNPLKKRVAYYVTRCCDGTTSSAKGRGACSHHGGVCNWNDPVYETYRKY